MTSLYPKGFLSVAGHPGPQNPWHYLDYTTDGGETCLPNKAPWEHEKTSTDVFWKAQTPQTESILSLRFHDSGPKQIPAKKSSLLSTGQAGGQAPPLGSPVPLERLAHVRPQCQVHTQASSQQPSIADANRLRGPMEASLKTVTSQQKNQWGTNVFNSKKISGTLDIKVKTEAKK